MASSNVKTGSEALTELQTNLSHLSEELHGIYELMYDNMIKIQEFWQDDKYNAFVADYRPQIEKCEEISKRYDEWCKKVLQPVIESAQEAENVDISGDAIGSSMRNLSTENTGIGGSSADGSGTSPSGIGLGVGAAGTIAMGVGIAASGIGGNSGKENSDQKPVDEMTTEELLKELAPEQRAAYENLKDQYGKEFEQGLSSAESSPMAIAFAKYLSSNDNDDNEFIPGVPDVTSATIKVSEKQKYENKMAQLHEDLKLGVQNNRNREEGIFPIQGHNSDNTTIGSPVSEIINQNPDMEALFHKVYPDMPSDPEIAKAYLKLPTDQRIKFDEEYKKLKDRHDYEVFHAEDRIQMGREISSDGGARAGAFWAAEGVVEDIVAEKKYMDGMRQLGESTMEQAGMKPPKPTTKAVPIANGCGSDSVPGSFAFAEVGRALDTANAVRKKSIGDIISPSTWKEEWDAQGESCNMHDICNYNQEGNTKCDEEFFKRSPIMASGVMSTKILGINNSYEAAGREHQESDQLQPTYEEEHGKKLDDNYRVTRND